MRSRSAATAVRCTAVLCAPTFAQTLDAVRSNVRSESPAEESPAPNSSSTEKSHSRSNFSSQDDSDWGLGTLAGFVLTSPYWVPFSLFDPGWDVAYEFPSFPYHQDVGYLQATPQPHDEWWQLRKARWWGGRFSTEYGDSFDDQSFLGARALIEGPLRFGVDLDVRHWEQTGEPWLGDSLWLGKSDVVFRFAQNECWQFRSGLGVNWMTDRAGSDLGFNFTYGVDWYPARPLIFSSEVDLGTLGEAWLFHARTSAGVIWGPTELYVAADYYTIGEAHLSGLATGLRLWF